MIKYEILAIIENSLDAKTAEKAAKTAIADRIEKELGGKITFADFWGERGFAYQINKQKWGYYVLYQFEMDPLKTQELRHELNLEAKIIRFLVTKVDARADQPRKYAEMKAEYEAQEKKKPVEAEAVKEVNQKNTSTKAKLTTIKEEPAPAKTEEKPKDEVDKKLDAIIDESTDDL